MLLSPVVKKLTGLDPNEFERHWRTLTPKIQQAAGMELYRMALLKRYPSPLELGIALNPEITSTPALRLASSLLLDYRDAIEVMYERRVLRNQLLKSGKSEDEVNELAVDMIPSRGRKRIIFSMPPQEGKSTLMSRYGPLWLMMQFPWLRFVLISYDDDKAAEFGFQVREDIILADGESTDVNLALELLPGQKSMSKWKLTGGGSMYAVGMASGISGRPADAIDIDDPTKDLNAVESIVQARNNVNRWETVVRPRLAADAPVMVVTTRWAENDFPGQLITKRDQLRDSGVKNYDDWYVVNIPAQAVEDDPLGRKPGEFMLSARGRTNADWEQTKALTTLRFWNGLYQGMPTPGSGNVFLREWVRFYDTILWSQQLDGTFKVPGYDLVQSWDMAFKDKKDSDYVTCGVWAVKGADAFLIYQLRARLSFTETVAAFRRITHLFPQARRKLVEDKANGTAVMDSLKHEIPGIIAVQVKDSKESRAEATTTFHMAGNIWIPSPEVIRASKVLSFDVDAMVEEWLAFPFGSHDDQVDQMTQFIQDRFIKHTRSRYGTAQTPGAKPPDKELTAIQKRLLKAVT
jgi:predicted phage terminase large subunit-like protein